MKIVNESIYQIGTRPNAIRDGFEYGLKRKAIVGEDNVFDYSLGNPSIPVPKILNETIIDLIKNEKDIDIHGYSSSSGCPELKKKIIDNLNETYGTNFTTNNIFVTCGAASALTGSLCALCASKEDEIIIFAPYFPEYKVFTLISECKVVEIPPDIPNFQINFKELEKKITKNTKALIINSPNNPSGAVYTEKNIKKLSDLLKQKEKEFNSHIYIISDEPYREIIFDNIQYPFISKYYENSIICYSFSKSMSIPGERIGYVLVSPTAYESQKILTAVAGAERIFGHVCAPMLLQKAIIKTIGHYSDFNLYKENRNILYKGLKELGYETNFPQGSFYLLLKSLEPDSIKFTLKAREFDLILVPADGFGCPGYVRIAFCVKKEMIEKSMVAFKKLKESYCK